MRTDLPICFIGDLHCRLDTARRIIRAYPDHFYVFMGDLVHSKRFFKQKTCSSFEMLSYVRGICAQDIGAVIMGNNEYSILANLITPEKKIRKKELRASLREVREMDFEGQMAWLRWLQDLPHKLEINEYVVSHAFPSDEREMALYGPGNIWFKPPSKLAQYAQLLPDKKYVVGHYGYPFISNQVKCIDATNFGGVGVYVTSPEQFLIFH